MPEAVYYTQADYIERFGMDEALRLTDEAGDGEVDAEKFTKAIADASADMDAYLRGRYALPFDPIPRVLSSIAAALVREKLHGNFPTQTVETEADRARKMLGDFATGKAQLVGPDGAQPPAGDLPSGIQIAPGSCRVFSREKLARF